MAERANGNENPSDVLVLGTSYLWWVEALKADLATVDVDEFAVTLCRNVTPQHVASHRNDGGGDRRGPLTG